MNSFSRRSSDSLIPGAYPTDTLRIDGPTSYEYKHDPMDNRLRCLCYFSAAFIFAALIAIMYSAFSGGSKACVQSPGNVLGLKFGRNTLDFHKKNDFLWISTDGAVRLYPYWTQEKFHDTVPKDYVWAIVSDEYTYYSHEHKDAANLHEILEWELWCFKSALPHKDLTLEFVRSDLRLRKYEGVCRWTGVVQIMDHKAYVETDRRSRFRWNGHMFREYLKADDWFLYDVSMKEGWKSDLQDPVLIKKGQWIPLQ